MPNDDRRNVVENDTAPVQKLVASSAMCYCCFDTLIDALRHHDRSGNPKFVNEQVDALVECPIFVTWEKFHDGTSSWQLRGCIGCLRPRILATAVEEYAIASAFNDRRFPPITMSEVHSLRVSVSLLVDYEVCRDVYDWIIGVHGILIKFVVNGRRYDATFLPEVAKQQRWDQSKTISSLIQKAGYTSTITQELLDGIHCTRYQSSKCQTTFEEYVDGNCRGKDPIGSPSSNNEATSRKWATFNNLKKCNIM